MKAHFGTPGVFSYPGYHTLNRKSHQTGKGKASSKPKYNMISPIAATDARMKIRAQAGHNKKKKKGTANKKTNKKTKYSRF